MSLKNFKIDVKVLYMNPAVYNSPNSFYEPHQDFTDQICSTESSSPSWYTNTSTNGMEVTELDSSTGFWFTMSQFTFSEEIEVDIYYYAFTSYFSFDISMSCFTLEVIK